MTSFKIHDFTPEKNGDPIHNAQSGVNINQFLTKFQNILIFVRVIPVQFLMKIAIHKVFKIADQNLQNLHIFAKFLNFAPIQKQSYFL